MNPFCFAIARSALACDSAKPRTDSALSAVMNPDSFATSRAFLDAFDISAGSASGAGTLLRRPATSLRPLLFQDPRCTDSDQLQCPFAEATIPAEEAMNIESPALIGLRFRRDSRPASFGEITSPGRATTESLAT